MIYFTVNQITMSFSVMFSVVLTEFPPVTPAAGIIP